MPSPTTDRMEFHQPFQAADILKALNDMRGFKVLTDVILAVEEEEFHCHRAVLAASSPYFTAMFAGNLRESRAERIKMEGIPSDTMQLHLDYAYTGRVTITRDNVFQLFETSDLLQVLPVKDACLTFLERILDVSNCIEIRKLAEIHSCDSLFRKARDLARSRFSKVIKTEEFLQLPKQYLVDYLSDDELNTENEEEIYKAIIRWIKFDRESRSQDLDQLIELVRLPFVTPEYLISKIALDPLVYNSDGCVQQIYEARAFQISGTYRRAVKTRQRRPRKCNCVEVMVVVCGEKKTFKGSSKAREVPYYDPVHQRWRALGPVPSKDLQVSSAVSTGYDIYITGGLVNDKARKDAMCYVSYLNVWKPIASMLHPRYHHGAAVLDGKVYVIGGYDGQRCLEDVERYDPDNDKWERLAPLVHAVKCPAVAAYDGRIYVFGGFYDGYNISRQLQCYDPHTNSWSVVESNMIDYTCAHAVRLDNRIYLLGGSSKTVKAYDPSDDSIVRVADMNIKRDNCGVSVVGGKIYVSGGVTESNGPALDCIECYDPRKDEWTFGGHKLPCQLYRHGFVTVQMYKEDIHAGQT
ncbi:kelch-like protein 24 [Branchiostoma floridae x Branchiostoma belcheri]